MPIEGHALELIVASGMTWSSWLGIDDIAIPALTVLSFSHSTYRFESQLQHTNEEVGYLAELMLLELLDLRRPRRNKSPGPCNKFDGQCMRVRVDFSPSFHCMV